MGLPLQTDNQYNLIHAYNTFLCENGNEWKIEADLKPKLRTFNKIHDFDSKQILANPTLSRYQRSILTQLKIGILPLRIETDRYQGIAPEERLCRLCALNQTEDEIHFLFTCPTLSDFCRASL